MRFSALVSAVALAALPSVFATSSWSGTVSTTATHMADLHSALNSVESAARACGNTQVIATCGTARSQLNSAQSALTSISSTSAFKSSPGAVGSSSQGAAIQAAIAKCGSTLSVMQSQIDSHPKSSSQLKQAYGRCSTHYQGCSGGVRELCGKPPKPTSTPKPPKPTTTKPTKPTTTPCTTTTKTWGPSQTARNGGGRGGGHGGGNGGGRGGGNGGGNGRGGWKRSTGSSTDALYCPNSEVACPISSLGSGVECVDTAHELTSCGGCSSIGEGKDCTQIPGVAGVGCASGECFVFSCQVGFTLSKTGACVPSFNSRIVIA